MHALLMPAKKRLPVGRRAPAAHVKEVRRIVRANRETIAAHAKWLRQLSKSQDWNNHRNYELIIGMWKGVGVGIESRLVYRAKKNNGKLRIWEDGAGRGYFGGVLKEELTRKGVHAHLTATTLNKKEIVPTERDFFDEVRAGKSELFVPKAPFDFIFSTMGSMNYTPPLLRKQHLLKMAYSLGHGGQMFVAFYHHPNGNQDERRKAIVGSLLDHPPKKPIHVGEEMGAIVKAFAKRGFMARFHYLDVHDGIVGLHVTRK